MPGPLLTLRALGGSNSTSTDIVTDARYQLARPDLVNGVPSLSLVSSNQACTVRTYIDGVFNTSLTVATTGSIPMLKASGAMLSAVELAALTFDVSGLQYAEVLHVTDEPAGSPTSPFTSTTTVATLAALAATGPDEIWIANPAVPRGKSKLVVNAARTNYVPPKGEAIVSLWGTPASQLRIITPGVLTFVELFGATGNLSPIIPDFMIPDGIIMEFVCYAGSKNTAGVPGANIGAMLSGSATIEPSAPKYQLASFGYTPATIPVGIAKPYSTLIARSGAVIGHGSGSTASISGLTTGGANTNPFTAGAMRVRINGQASKVDDVFVIEGFTICSMGNL